MSPTPSRLSDHTGYWLRILSNHVSGSFAARLEKHGVSVPQWNLLRVAYDRDGATSADLAEALKTDPGALSRMIDRLIAAGLIIRKESPSDRRAVAIFLTETGRALVPDLASEADENDRAFFGELPADEEAAFLTIIRKLLEFNSVIPNDSSLK